MDLFNQFKNLVVIYFSGYSVERIDGSSDLVISAAIMAGFLPFADTEELRGEINFQLETMFRSVMVILYTTDNGRMID